MNIFPQLETEIDVLVEGCMQQWNVPGLALAVVDADGARIVRGYGVLHSQLPQLVDEHTLFAIGSNTKAFTAAAIGALVQDGRLSWDDPVRRWLPWFELYDAHATHDLRVRDLLCHRSGLATWAGDVLLSSNEPPDDVVRRLRHIPPGYPFRAGYGYSNLMFITAGQVIAAVSGQSWDDFVRTRLLEPAGMNDSVTHPRYLGERQNAAHPHEDVDGAMQPVTFYKDGSVGAAGSICASAADLARLAAAAPEPRRPRRRADPRPGGGGRDADPAHADPADGHRAAADAIAALRRLWAGLVLERHPRAAGGAAHRRAVRDALQHSVAARAGGGAGGDDQ